MMDIDVKLHPCYPPPDESFLIDIDSIGPTNLSY